MPFVKVPSIYPKLLELRQSKTASFKPNKYFKKDTRLRYYQVVGALHMLLLERMVLGDATGLGKAIQSIAAYSYLLDRDPSLKLLIVCQKSAMYQWQEEFEKFIQGISTRVISLDYERLKGRKAREEQYKIFKENVLIINYYPLLEEYERLIEILSPNFMVVFDECVSFKSRKSKTHFACSEIAQAAKRVYGLSATIIKNGLEEVYGIYAVIVPGLFGRITHFKKAYCKEKKMKLRINKKVRLIPKVIGYKNLDQFKQVLDPYFLLRRKEEVASELPKLISRKIVLDMADDQRELYKQALSGIIYEEKTKQEFFEVAERIRNGDIDGATMKKYETCKEKYEVFLTEDGKKRGKLAALTYCQMVSNGPSLVGESGESSKEQEFERLIRDELSNDKVIVFTRFKRGIPQLEIVCERLKAPYVKITGDQTSKERDDARIRFMNDPACNIIFITTAGSSSLNLQAAGVIIFYDTPWSYGDLVQTIGRAQRIGSLQEHIVLMHMINRKTIDERVMNRVTSKKNLSDEILGDTAKGALDFTEVESSIVNDLFQDILKDAEDG